MADYEPPSTSIRRARAGTARSAAPGVRPSASGHPAYSRLIHGTAPSTRHEGERAWAARYGMRPAGPFGGPPDVMKAPAAAGMGHRFSALDSRKRLLWPPLQIRRNYLEAVLAKGNLMPVTTT